VVVAYFEYIAANIAPVLRQKSLYVGAVNGLASGETPIVRNGR
jgi:hypothetical protein